MLLDRRIGIAVANGLQSLPTGQRLISHWLCLHLCILGANLLYLLHSHLLYRLHPRLLHSLRPHLLAFLDALAEVPPEPTAPVAPKAGVAPPVIAVVGAPIVVILRGKVAVQPVTGSD